jgi:hypothetical protein
LSACARFQSSRTPGVVIGGVAAAVLGRPRVTGDIDAVVLIEEARWPDFLEAGAAFGFVPRRADCLEFATRTRVLLVRHAPSSVDVDISLGVLPFEREMIAGARWRDLAGVLVPLPAPEDLVVMKAVAGRARDIADIEDVVAINPDLDRSRIRQIVAQFAEALDDPEMVAKLDTALGRQPITRPGRKRKAGPGRGAR